RRGRARSGVILLESRDGRETEVSNAAGRLYRMCPARATTPRTAAALMMGAPPAVRRDHISPRGQPVAITIYDQLVPVFSQMLKALDKVLAKAEADAEARKIDPSVYTNGRLA